MSTGYYADKELIARVIARVQEAGSFARYWNHDAAAMATAAVKTA